MVGWGKVHVVVVPQSSCLNKTITIEAVVLILQPINSAQPALSLSEKKYNDRNVHACN